MKTRRLPFIATILFVGLAAASLAACGLIPKPDNTPVNQYDIAPQMPAAGSSAGSMATTRCAQVLQMRGVQASAPWSSSNMLYTQNKHEIKSYAYNNWAATPATMLGHALVSALQASGLYRGVVGPSSPGRADLVLAVSLKRGPLQVFPPQSGKKGNEAKTSREVLVLSAALTSTEDGKLIAARTFSGSRSAQPDPYGGVVAANAVAGKLFGQMLDWLRQTNANIEACASR